MEYYSCESESGKWHLNDETYGEQPNSINQVVQKLQNQNQLVKKKQTMIGRTICLLKENAVIYYKILPWSITVVSQSQGNGT